MQVDWVYVKSIAYIGIQKWYQCKPFLVLKLIITIKMLKHFTQVKNYIQPTLWLCIEWSLSGSPIVIELFRWGIPINILLMMSRTFHRNSRNHFNLPINKKKINF